ncbi:MAG: TerC family protein [Trueperaceae bacterium]|nr:TerC family protein [Trueperaceae bacterium]
MLALDLGVFHRKAHVVKVREAGFWTAVWVTLSLSFGAVIWNWLGREKGIEYLTGYVLEWSLAVDNIFVFVLVFNFFRTPFKYQQRVLLWGVLGALILRGIMIGVGVTLIENFHWILYVFGAFLLFTGLRMLFSKGDGEADLSKNPGVKLVQRFFRVSTEYDGQKFFTVKDGIRYATPLLLVLVVIEFTDVVFAVDSIPAIFAVTTDPFIVFTSNVMAILGLRSMYFLLAHVVHRFVYLKTGLAVILTYIGAKMLLLDVFHIPTLLSLGVVVSVLVVSIVASLMFGKPDEEMLRAAEAREAEAD